MKRFTINDPSMSLEGSDDFTPREMSDVGLTMHETTIIPAQIITYSVLAMLPRIIVTILLQYFKV